MTLREKCGIFLVYTVITLKTVGICHAQEFSARKFNDLNSFRTSIYTLSPFRFGVFYPGHLGGSVTVSDDGTRTSSGTVVLLPPGIVGPAAFEIRTASNRMVQLNYEKQILLKSASGASILLVADELSRGNPFVSPSNAESGFTVTLGGTVELRGSAQNPPGEYSGIFQVSLVVE